MMEHLAHNHDNLIHITDSNHMVCRIAYLSKLQHQSISSYDGISYE